MASLSASHARRAEPAQVAAWLATIGVCVGVLVMAISLAPHVDPGAIPGFLIGFATVGASSIAAGGSCPPLHRRMLWWLVVPVVVLGMLSDTRDPDALTAALVAASLWFGGSLLGSVVGGEVEHAGYLVYVAIVSAAVDTASVFHPAGPSAVIAASPGALSVVAVPFPILGTDRIGPLLGVGDVVFTALYLAACRRHGLSRARTVAALAVGFAATAGLVAWLAEPVPALPLLGGAIVAVHPAARRVPSRDLLKGALTVSVIVAVCVVLVLMRHH